MVGLVMCVNVYCQSFYKQICSFTDIEFWMALSTGIYKCVKSWGYTYLVLLAVLPFPCLLYTTWQRFNVCFISASSLSSPMPIRQIGATNIGYSLTKKRKSRVVLIHSPSPGDSVSLPKAPADSNCVHRTQEIANWIGSPIPKSKEDLPLEEIWE